MSNEKLVRNKNKPHRAHRTSFGAVMLVLGLGLATAACGGDVKLSASGLPLLEEIIPEALDAARVIDEGDRPRTYDLEAGQYATEGLSGVSIEFDLDGSVGYQWAENWVVALAPNGRNSDDPIRTLVIATPPEDFYVREWFSGDRSAGNRRTAIPTDVESLLAYVEAAETFVAGDSGESELLGITAPWVELQLDPSVAVANFQDICATTCAPSMFVGPVVGDLKVAQGTTQRWYIVDRVEHDIVVIIEAEEELFNEWLERALNIVSNITLA